MAKHIFLTLAIVFGIAVVSTGQAGVQSGTGITRARTTAPFILITPGVTNASLGSDPNGTIRYCSDCTIGATTSTTCAGAGTGAIAKRLNGAWICG